MPKTETIILGAGMTGLSAGLVSGKPVFEAETVPGGICSSYYLEPKSSTPQFNEPEDGEVYRFEIGGGHWIFGGDPAVLKFIKTLTPVKSYKRKSSVFFSKEKLYVPYPIQNHLSYLGKNFAITSINEIVNSPDGIPKTMEDWLVQSFGKTLMKKFFAPFHELYTAGLWTKIAPQDAYKSPVNLKLALQGAYEKIPPAVGYNVTYLYPKKGLNFLSQLMASRCNVDYGMRVSRIDSKKKEVSFSDGTVIDYKKIISTLPLNIMLELCGMEIDEENDLYTSVLVLNIGAVKGRKCPDDHWLYIPDSDSGFHRVGFYSNVDPSFLPTSSRKAQNRVSIYVEKAFKPGSKPSKKEINSYSKKVVKELQSLKFIQESETVHPTWIEVAYTWSKPGSNWKQIAIKELEKKSIYQIGRYGRWVFQGIADSIKDGFFIGGAFKI
jgi:protoporphyrinogen oxidase